MAGGMNRVRDEAEAGRPLWLAGLAGLLTASLLAWIVIIGWLSYDNARLDAGDAFEGDGVVPPPEALTADWWAGAASAYPKIAALFLLYAVPLVAILAAFERIGAGRRAIAAGTAAAAPLAFLWLVLAALAPEDVSWRETLVPILLLVAVGAVGGAAAVAVRNRPGE